jgi:uncharacterized protein (DUF2147 family)
LLYKNITELHIMAAPIRATIWVLFLLASMAPMASRSAEAASPIGLWKTVDDTTGSARALVRIYEQDGKLFGRIEKVFEADAEHQVCTACKDDRKNQPIVGLIIIRNIKPAGNAYEGGDVLDPESGSVYRCKMHLESGGDRLILRGYIGFSFIGRSQTWQRQP